MVVGLKNYNKFKDSTAARLISNLVSDLVCNVNQSEHTHTLIL